MRRSDKNSQFYIHEREDHPSRKAHLCLTQDLDDLAECPVKLNLAGLGRANSGSSKNLVQELLALLDELLGGRNDFVG
jgi:hypothetical protein